MDLLEKAVELGLGALVITKENVEKVTNDLVKKGKLKKYEGNSLIQEMLKKGKVQEKKIETDVTRIVSKTLSKLDIAGKADIRRLEKKLQELKNSKH